MALSPTEICNRALDDIGHAAIQSLLDNTTASKVCNRKYSEVLGELLGSSQWLFAKTRAPLTPVTSTRALGWYAFAKPNNVAGELMMLAGADLPGGIFVGGAEVPLPYEIQEDVYYTRYSSVQLVYVRNDPSPAYMPANFLKALQAGIASRICYPLKKDDAERTRLLGEYELYRDRAVALELNSQPSVYGNFIPSFMMDELTDDLEF